MDEDLSVGTPTRGNLRPVARPARALIKDPRLGSVQQEQAGTHPIEESRRG
jgi:hypothetical protein